MENKNKIYLAIDSDVLRTLTLLDILKTEHGHVNISKIKEYKSSDLYSFECFSYSGNFMNSVYTIATLKEVELIKIN